MNIYIIIYSISEKNNDNLISAIKENCKWWHYLEMAWIIQTEETLNDLTTRLTSKIDKGGNLLILDVSINASNGWLPKEAWDWINNLQK